MKKNILIASTLLIAATATWLYAASTDRAADRDRGPYHHGPYHHGPHDHGSHDPIIGVFDTDGDNRIGTTEIENAASILASFDRDGDGVLVHEELPRPPRPGESCSKPQCASPPAENSKSTTMTKSKSGDVQLHDGYQTDPRDGGRPVGLIASALEVDEQIFRIAFSEVRPARGGPPSEATKRANKKILMDALSPHGVTDERLNEVSNFYRYRPEAGEMWTHRAAKINAVIENGQVTDFVVEDPGFGYLCEPKVSVVGYPEVQVQVSIAFDRDLHRNGRIESLELVDETTTPKQ